MAQVKKSSALCHTHFLSLLGVGKGRCDEVPPRFSCTVTPVLIGLQAERENLLGDTQTKSFLQLSSI